MSKKFMALRQVVPDAEVGNPTSYHCSTPQLMPVASIDPSLAIGFYCRSAGVSLNGLAPVSSLRPCSGR